MNKAETINTIITEVIFPSLKIDTTLTAGAADEIYNCISLFLVDFFQKILVLLQHENCTVVSVDAVDYILRVLSNHSSLQQCAGFDEDRFSFVNCGAFLDKLNSVVWDHEDDTSDYEDALSEDSDESFVDSSDGSMSESSTEESLLNSDDVGSEDEMIDEEYEEIFEPDSHCTRWHCCDNELIATDINDRSKIHLPNNPVLESCISIISQVARDCNCYALCFDLSALNSLLFFICDNLTRSNSIFRNYGREFEVIIKHHSMNQNHSKDHRTSNTNETVSSQGGVSNSDFNSTSMFSAVDVSQMETPNPMQRATMDLLKIEQSESRALLGSLQELIRLMKSSQSGQQVHFQADEALLSRTLEENRALVERNRVLEEKIQDLFDTMSSLPRVASPVSRRIQYTPLPISMVTDSSTSGSSRTSNSGLSSITYSVAAGENTVDTLESRNINKSSNRVSFSGVDHLVQFYSKDSNNDVNASERASIDICDIGSKRKQLNPNAAMTDENSLSQSKKLCVGERTPSIV